MLFPQLKQAVTGIVECAVSKNSYHPYGKELL